MIFNLFVLMIKGPLMANGKYESYDNLQILMLNKSPFIYFVKMVQLIL